MSHTRPDCRTVRTVFVILWFCDFVILWFCDSLYTNQMWPRSSYNWSRDSAISRFRDFMIPQFRDSAILRFHDFAIPWFASSRFRDSNFFISRFLGRYVIGPELHIVWVMSLEILFHPGTNFPIQQSTHFWFSDFLILWFCDSLYTNQMLPRSSHNWFRDSATSRFRDFAIPQFRDSAILWFRDFAFPWLREFAIPRF